MIARVAIRHAVFSLKDGTLDVPKVELTNRT